ncbi:hypothetical protein [Flavobacterium sp. SORGH_AS_0622]|uniref:hypothetical protein n=1 Tax=Flavobacterium sp. SORGH_AS_0622 TaxID=3041772 RepID=UPI0027879568|nr:hypothetical protein [Flavobacterium sp. SORGH_AS_0622]MDQ1165895.1 hypothetical protein [Flavobacterium sp. SORGH_AS_0622]
MYTTLLILSAISFICIAVFGILALFLRNNKKTYKTLASVFTILSVAFASLTQLVEKKEEKSNKKVEKEIEKPSNVYHIKGDFINRDKNVQNNSNKNTPVKLSTSSREYEAKSSETKSEAIKPQENIINNGIINSGVNNGVQTVNNYSEIPIVDRHLTSEDIDLIKSKIPMNYDVNITCESGEETINYSNEILKSLNRMGYKITSAESVNMLIEGAIQKKKGIKFHIIPNEKLKKAFVMILNDY